MRKPVWSCRQWLSVVQYPRVCVCVVRLHDDTLSNKFRGRRMCSDLHVHDVVVVQGVIVSECRLYSARVWLHVGGERRFRRQLLALCH